eukprot:TRINITY_DN50_c2_g1_i1.p1 TRINITY_DN50_c2_g1~~TRINITY_DN50_c2_g1_i1.p1  ORF type:complete len:272 (-),score=117.40 TRINITY_DN50_c2_g1_i1:109-924(-)
MNKFFLNKNVFNGMNRLCRIRNIQLQNSFINIRTFATNKDPSKSYATTILCVRKNGQVIIIGDGQVTRGSEIIKTNAKKIRVLKDGAITGFAGSVADALTLLEKLEAKLEEYPGQLLRACVELAKLWRSEKYLRHLEASLIVADKNISLEVNGGGEVMESIDGLLSIGSGGGYALACARGLMTVDNLSAEEIGYRSMKVAADMCIYTSHNFILEKIDYSADNSDLPTTNSSTQSETTGTTIEAETNKVDTTNQNDSTDNTTTTTTTTLVSE